MVDYLPENMVVENDYNTDRIRHRRGILRIDSELIDNVNVNVLMGAIQFLPTYVENRRCPQDLVMWGTSPYFQLCDRENETPTYEIALTEIGVLGRGVNRIEIRLNLNEA